jgi:hypothetical protein
MPGINPMALQELVQRAAQGDPGASQTLQQLGYSPDGQPMPPPGGMAPPGGMPPGGGGPPGMGGGPPMGPGGPPPGGGGMPPPGGGGMPPPGGGGGGPPMDPRMMQAAQMSQGLRR